jgi:hypothetical protein
MKDILSGQGTMSVKIEPKSSISFEHGEVEHGEFEGTSQKKLERLTVGYVIEHSSAFAKPWQSYLLRDNRVADMPSLPLESFTMKLYTGNGKECGSVRMTFKREKIGNKTSSEVSDSKWIEQPDLTGVVASCLVTEPR